LTGIIGNVYAKMICAVSRETKRALNFVVLMATPPIYQFQPIFKALYIGRNKHVKVVSLCRATFHIKNSLNLIKYHLYKRHFGLKRLQICKLILALLGRNF